MGRETWAGSVCFQNALMQPLDVVNTNQPVPKEQKMQFVLSSGDQLEETSICHAESTPMLCEGIKGMQTKSKKWFICDFFQWVIEKGTDLLV